MSCKYCDGNERDIESNVYIRNERDIHRLYYLGIDCWENPVSECIDINFCPMCGSRLGDSDDR